MWHEARKQERLLKSMMVDHRRRAERRREYYEKTKGDPAQFLQIHGRPCKIHIDPAIAAAADSPATMMPWQGQPDIKIDRFDVRAHLDFIPSRPKKEESDSSDGSDEELWEERQASYERYRILVQNEFIGVSEEKFLHQIHVEEQFGPVQKVGEDDKKKMLASKKAAIGFTYEDSTNPTSSALPPTVPLEATEDDDSDSDIDLDLSIAVDKLTTEQMHEVNKCALHYGLGRQDFMSLLTRDLDEQESMRVAKEEEQERAMYSGRKARKERRAFREQKLQALLQNRCLSPPSYATRASPTYGQYRRSASASKSRSPSPPFEGGIKFITSFGDDESDNDAKNSKSLAKSRGKDATAKRTVSGKDAGRSSNDQRKQKIQTVPSNSRDRRSRSRSWSRRRRSHSRDRPFHRSADDRNSKERRMRSKIRSLSRRSRSRSHSRQKSRSNSRRRTRSRTGSVSRRRSRSRSRSRSPRRWSRSKDHRRERRRSPSWFRSQPKRSRRSRSYSSRKHDRERSSSRNRRDNRRDNSKSSSSTSSNSSETHNSKASSPSRSPTPEPVAPPRTATPPAPPTVPFMPILVPTPLPPPPVRRYYGRKKSDSDSSISDSELSPPSKTLPTTLSSKSSVPAMIGSSVGTSTGATKVKSSDTSGTAETQNASRFKQTIQGG